MNKSIQADELTVAQIEKLSIRLDKLERIKVDIEYIKKDVSEIKNVMKEVKLGYVTQREFDPYKKILMACIIGLIANSIALIYR